MSLTVSKKRVEKLQSKLKELDITGAFYATSANFQYLLDANNYWYQRNSETKLPATGIGLQGVNVPDAVLYVPSDGDPAVVCIPRRLKDLENIGYKVSATYADSIIKELKNEFKGKGKKFAIGHSSKEWFEEMIREIIPDAETVFGEDYVDELRLIKDETEIEAMSKVAELTDIAMGRIVDILKPGISAFEVENALVQVGMEYGAEDISFFQNAIFTKMGHPTAQEKHGYDKDLPLENGMGIAFDFGYVLNGYCSDFGRTFWSGKAPKHIVDAYHALQAGQVNMIKNIKPNVTNMKDLFGYIQDVVTERGFLDQLQFVDKGTVGHQIGIDVHELPWVNRYTDMILRPGMVFCSEPKIWFKGECYMRVEDMVLVTEDGAVSLTNFDRDLFELI